MRGVGGVRRVGWVRREGVEVVTGQSAGKDSLV